MVAQITDGTAFDKRGRPFRRRNYLPGILLFITLAVVTLSVWVMALNQPVDVHEAAACNAPPPAADPSVPAQQLGEQLSRSRMTEVTPAKLADTKIRVLNASGQGGQAAEVASELRDLGYAEPVAANDTVYANARLECQGQMCTELFQDQRSDATVDLAIGTEFTELTHSDDIDAVLASLRPDATLAADPALLKKIHTAAC